jgi:hypothetical protein
MILKIPHPQVSDYPSTNLSAAEAVGSTAINVVNTGGVFADNDYGFFNTLGTPAAEIFHVNGTPADTSFNIDTAIAFAHAIDTQVTYIPYNQVAIEHSTNLQTLLDTNLYATIALASAAATWTATTTVDIEPSQKNTTYHDTSGVVRSYRYRYYKSDTAVYSTYSDPILPDGYENRTVGEILQRVMLRLRKDVGQTEFAQITSTMLIAEVNNALDEIDEERKRWSNKHSFSASLSEITPGINYYNLPRNIDVNYTNRAVKAIRIKNGENLIYIDKQEFDEKMEDVINTTTTQSLTSASTTLTVTDSSNLGDTGSFVIFTTTTKNTVTWTANNRSTNTLTLSGVSTSVTTTHASGTDIWVGATFSSNPRYYTIYGRTVYFPQVPDTTLYLRRIDIDYYKSQVKVNSENDIIDIPDQMLIFYYVLWAVEDSLDHSDKANTYLIKFQQRLETLKRNETSGQKRTFSILLPIVGRLKDSIFTDTSINRDDD